MKRQPSPLHRALIVTVGQTPAPILASIKAHAPDGIIFIASQQTLAVVASITQTLDGATWHHTLLLNDPEDLKESYRQADQALKLALSKDAQAISADITGGTKPMVAGVMLALSGRGVTFSYVGGERRDAAGRVESGYERLRQLEDPTTRYHVREWQTVMQAWNGQRFGDALAALERIFERPLSRAETHFFNNFRGLVQALDSWDSFHHQQALKLLKQHLEPALVVAEVWRHANKVRVLSELQQQRERLQQLVEAKGPNQLLLEDLLANAERRAATGRFDDAVARLYRAIELLVEIDIYSRHGIDLKAKKPFDKLPDDLKQKLSDVRSRFSKALGLKELLEVAANIDQIVQGGDSLAQKLHREYHQTLLPLLKNRHNSILAHGLKPVAAEAYQQLKDFLAENGAQAAPPWPQW